MEEDVSVDLSQQQVGTHDQERVKALKLLTKDEASFLKLPLIEGKGRAYKYYTFDVEWPITLLTNWNIVAIRLHKQDPWLLEVGLIHIEEEELEIETFQPLNDAGGFISFQPSEFLQLSQFFSTFSEARPENILITHFAELDKEKLVSMHIPEWRFSPSMSKGLGSYYQYIPERNIQKGDKISLLRLPSWQNSIFGKNQESGLVFCTFDRHELADPQFNPFEGQWRGFITFTKSAWQDFIALLRQRTYEQFLHKHGQ